MLKSLNIAVVQDTDQARKVPPALQAPASVQHGISRDCMQPESIQAAAPDCKSRKLLVKERELGVIRGGWGGWGRRGGGPKLVVFSAIPHLELGKTLLPKGIVLGQISVLLSTWLFRRPKEKQASSDAADAGLGVSADAADAGRMLLMLVVSWPRCA